MIDTMKDLSKRAKEIIEKIQYVTIASVTEDGMPWNSPVFAAYDEDFNFYWGTHSDSQKAKNIRSNGNVFLVIYDSTVPSGTGEGVYIKAIAQQIPDPNEVKRVFGLLRDRHATSFWDFAAVSQEGPIRLFKATPQQAWMNDGGHENGHYIDTRTEINL
jgi:pyridoxine/pyridoxamine 5'-phosphate oxidase